jgi:putative hydrolase of the HAD superfamily
MNPLVNWQQIDTVLLDMDGTLLDLHFDNHFWQTHLPRRYAESLNRPHAAVQEEMNSRYHQSIGTLDWYSVDFWQTELGLDIMQLKAEVAHLIAIHPHVIDFLNAVRQSGRRLVLATNAHQKSIDLKMEKTGLTAQFDAVISSHALGAAKEEQAFWQRLHDIEIFDPARTLLVDDNLSVLDSARQYGIAHLVAVKKPDTRQPRKHTADYPAMDDFSQLLPCV